LTRPEKTKNKSNEREKMNTYEITATFHIESDTELGAIDILDKWLESNEDERIKKGLYCGSVESEGSV